MGYYTLCNPPAINTIIWFYIPLYSPQYYSGNWVKKILVLDNYPQVENIQTIKRMLHLESVLAIQLLSMKTAHCVCYNFIIAIQSSTNTQVGTLEHLLICQYIPSVKSTFTLADTNFSLLGKSTMCVWPNPLYYLLYSLLLSIMAAPYTTSLALTKCQNIYILVCRNVQWQFIFLLTGLHLFHCFPLKGILGLFLLYPMFPFLTLSDKVHNISGIEGQGSNQQ